MTTIVTPELWKILSIFYFPLLYYPLLVCGTLRSKLGYVLGSLLSWTHLAILCWQKYDCPKTPEVRQRDRSVGEATVRHSLDVLMQLASSQL